MTATQRKRNRTPHQPVGRWITPIKRVAIYLRDGFLCVYCAKDLLPEPQNEVTLDHIKPLRFGGSNAPSNLVTACKACNCARGHRRVKFAFSAQALDRVRRCRYRSWKQHLQRAAELLREEELA